MNGLFKFYTLLLLCFCFYTGAAQESLQKHTVSSGETIASIANKYMVTAYELQQANPGLTSGIKANDILNIPQSTIKSPQLKSVADSLRASIVSAPTEYTVKRGDTKFSLARRFGLTIKGLESRNPHIVPTLQEGQILNVPEERDSQSNLERYVVTRVDTKFGLARKFNTTIPELERINPHIVKMLLVGQTIKIPQHDTTAGTREQVPETKKTTVQQPTTPVNPSKKVLQTETTPVAKDVVAPKTKPSEKTIEKQIQTPPTVAKISEETTSKYSNLAASIKTSKQKKLLFVLPFSQSEYHAFKTDDRFEKVSDEFKKSHLEFYRGASMAIDSLKKLKLNIEVDILIAKNKIEKAEIKSLAKLQQVATYDGIILPYYDTIDEELAALIAEDNIPVVTASQVSNQNPSRNLYSALPSANLQRKKILDHLASKKGNVIVINDVDRDDSKTFIAEHAPNATIIDLKKNGTFNNDELIGKFKKNQVNYVILNSDRNSVFINTTNILLSELSNYTIQIAILESNLIPDKSDVSKKRYQILKMLFPSFTSAKATASQHHFTQTYLKKYKVLPTANVLSGFDITMDTLLRMAQEESFQNSAENHVTEYTHLKFDYEKNAKGGFSNQGIYILHYDTGSDIKEIN